MTYEVGDLARLSVSFTDINGVLADPTVVTLLVQAPDNSQVQYALPPIIRVSTGKYYYDLNVLQSGSYFYRWTGTGALQVVIEGSITVATTTLIGRPSPTGPGAYTYQYGANPLIDFVRLLIPDTQFLPRVSPPQMIFADQEIQAFYNIQRNTFQSGMFFSYNQGRNLPGLPLSYVRVAALALDTLANNKGKLGNVIKLLDVSLDWKSAAAVLREGPKLTGRSTTTPGRS